jgi:DNA-binding Xre family transcriptional regulator
MRLGLVPLINARRRPRETSSYYAVSTALPCYDYFIMKKLLEVDGVNLRELRRDRALAQEDLQRMTGVAQSTLSALEIGKRDAQPRTVRRLAEALGVEPRELMRRGGDE